MGSCMSCKVSASFIIRCSTKELSSKQTQISHRIKSQHNVIEKAGKNSYLGTINRFDDKPDSSAGSINCFGGDGSYSVGSFDDSD